MHIDLIVFIALYEAVDVVDGEDKFVEGRVRVHGET
jgi:hypothetical protein